MDKLIIHHGERVTEHELGDQPLVIGRDPECDLFFADKKLSRHHARVERSGVGVRLVDLGSRNGTWVNEERVQEREVSPGDEIRLGGLLIHVERLGPPPAREEEGDESTMFLPTGAPPEETGTVVLDASDRQAIDEPREPSAETAFLSPREVEAAARADDSATVFLKGGPPPTAAPASEEGDSDETLKKPEPERTVVLDAASPKSPFDTGTVVFRGQADPGLREAARGSAHDPGLAKEASAAEEHYHSSLDASLSFEPGGVVSGRGWAFRFSWIVVGLGLFSFVVLALPTLRIARLAASEESAKRARALVELLAAANETALGEGRERDLAVDRALSETGVTGAFLLSPAGEILAPRDRSGQKLQIDGVEPLADVRNFRTMTATNGDTVLAQPISYRGRRVGVAVLRHRPGEAFAGSATVTLAFGTLLLVVAIVVSVLLAARLTVAPMEELCSDIDALGDGGERLSTVRAYRELSRLAQSVDHLVDRRAAPR